MVKIDRLKISQFKNIENEDLHFYKGIHFIVGPNGAGKTNVLDALYYLCMGKSYFQSSDKSVVQHGSDFFRLEAELQTDTHKMTSQIKCRPGLSKELIWDNCEMESITSYIGKLPVVFIAPDDIYTFTHFSEERRKFLNQTLIQKDVRYLDHLMQYNKALKQKLAALKDMKRKQQMDHILLSSYDQLLHRHGFYIYKKRKEVVEELEDWVHYFLQEISGGIQRCKIIYQSNASVDFAIQLEKSHEQDYFSQRISIGIHKDQIEVLMDEKKLNQFGSQGQIKSFLLALRLAQARWLSTHTQLKPIMLLDDIFAKLDTDRVTAFLQLLAREDMDQCFITDTHMERALALKKKLDLPFYIYTFVEGKIILQDEKIQ